MKPEDFTRRIARLRTRFEELEQELADPSVYSDRARAGAVARERTSLLRIFDTFDAWCKAFSAIQENEQLLAEEDDPDLRALAEEDSAAQKRRAQEAERALLLALLPTEKTDSRNAIMEIRPAAGGDEAALFASEVFHMYLKYAELRGWRIEVLDLSESELGGVKTASFSLSGEDVFRRLKFESGVHRVQRVPATESGGRIHTSTITVSVLPEASELDEIVIRPDDLKIDTYRSSGAGGQYVNRTDSAVRIHHIPSGLVVESQQERSQIRNREIALRILKSKLLEAQRLKEAEKVAESRRMQIGTGDRSEKVRTYNFPQSRVTDHRFHVETHNIAGLMAGNLDLILDPLFRAYEDELIRRTTE